MLNWLHFVAIRKQDVSSKFNNASAIDERIFDISFNTESLLIYPERIQP